MMGLEPINPKITAFKAAAITISATYAFGPDRSRTGVFDMQNQYSPN